MMVPSPNRLVSESIVFSRVAWRPSELPFLLAMIKTLLMRSLNRVLKVAVPAAGQAAVRW
jgi:hypothetical protein